MERLAGRNDGNGEAYLFNGIGGVNEAIDKLAAYEDAEEQGRLVVLPCKVGDTVYYLNQFGEIEDGKITMIQQKADGTWKFRVTTDFSRDVTTDAIGKTVLLTREEAEKALGRMKDG